MIWRRRVSCICVLVLSACALKEGPPPTPMPPLTVTPPAELSFVGDCNVNRDLANWLQFTAYQNGEFSKLVSTSATMSLGEIYDNVLILAKIRRVVSETPAPDCAEPAQRMVIETMNRAIEGFQSRVNGENLDLNRLVAEILGQFDQINLIYDELNTRLETQLGELTTSDNNGS